MSFTFSYPVRRCIRVKIQGEGPIGFRTFSWRRVFKVVLLKRKILLLLHFAFYQQLLFQGGSCFIPPSESKGFITVSWKSVLWVGGFFWRGGDQIDFSFFAFLFSWDGPVLYPTLGSFYSRIKTTDLYRFCDRNLTPHIFGQSNRVDLKQLDFGFTSQPKIVNFHWRQFN